MPGAGETLRQEREAGGKTLEEMAEATGIRLDFLTALEQEVYETLPGRGFGKLYIRAYAEVLGFDPRPVIDAYDRAQNARPPGASYATPFTPPPVEATRGEPEAEELPEEPEPEPAVEAPEFDARWAKEGWEPREQVATPEPAPEPVPQPLPAPVPIPVASTKPARREILPPTPASARRPWLRTAAVLLLLLTAVVVAISVRYRRAEASPPAAVVLPQPTPAPVRPVPAPEPAPRKELPPPSTSHLRVPEFGIGERDRFQAGQRVTFTTRVQGGRSGDRIRHVWMRDGKVEQAISLPVAASNWRTHSTKTVGRPGAWAVEARDADGQVLARASFDVVTR